MACDILARVPLEVSLQILGCGILDPSELGRLVRVCKRWHEIVSQQALWRQYAARLGLVPPRDALSFPSSSALLEAAAERTLGRGIDRAAVVVSDSWPRLVQEARGVAQVQGYDLARDGWRNMPRAVVSQVLDPLTWDRASPEAQGIFQQIMNLPDVHVRVMGDKSQAPLLDKPFAIFPDNIGVFSIEWSFEENPDLHDGFILFTVDLVSQELLWASLLLERGMPASSQLWALAQDPARPDLLLVQESRYPRDPPQPQSLVHVFRASWLAPSRSAPRGHLEKVGTLSALGSFVAHDVEEYDRIRLVYPNAAGFTWTPPALVVWDVTTCEIRRAIDLEPLFDGWQGPSLRALGARDGNDFVLDSDTNSIFFLLLFRDAVGFQRVPIDPDQEGGDMMAGSAVLFGCSTGLSSAHARYAALGTFFPFEAFRVGHTYVSAADPAQLESVPTAHLTGSTRESHHPQFQTTIMEHDKFAGMLVIAMQEQLLLVPVSWLLQASKYPGQIPQHKLPSPSQPVVLLMGQFPGRWDVIARFQLQPMRGQLSAHGGRALWGPNTLIDYACPRASDILVDFLDVASTWGSPVPSGAPEDLSQHLEHQYEMIRSISQYPFRCLGVKLTASAAFVLCLLHPDLSDDDDDDDDDLDDAQDAPAFANEPPRWGEPSRGNFRAEALARPRSFAHDFLSCVIRIDFDASRRLMASPSSSSKCDLGAWANRDLFTRAFSDAHSSQ